MFKRIYTVIGIIVGLWLIISCQKGSTAAVAPVAPATPKSDSSSLYNYELLKNKIWLDGQYLMILRFYGDSDVMYGYPYAFSPSGIASYDTIPSKWTLIKPETMHFFQDSDGSYIGGFDVISITDTLFKVVFPPTDTVRFRVIK